MMIGLEGGGNLSTCSQNEQQSSLGVPSARGAAFADLFYSLVGGPTCSLWPGRLSLLRQHEAYDGTTSCVIDYSYDGAGVLGPRDRSSKLEALPEAFARLQRTSRWRQRLLDR